MLLLAAVIGLGVPNPVKVTLALALGAHGLLRRPRSETRILLCRPGDDWVLPEHGIAGAGLRLGRGTTYTTLWVRLVLIGSTARFDLLLLEDQFDSVSWRILHARLRTAGSRNGLPS